MDKKRRITTLHRFYWIVIKEMWGSLWDATRWLQEKIAMTVFLLGLTVAVLIAFNQGIGDAVASWFDAQWKGFHPAWAVAPLVLLIFYSFVLAMHRKYVEIELENICMRMDINAEGIRIPVLQIVSHGIAVSENLISSDDMQNESLDDVAGFVREWIRSIYDNLDDVSTIDALHFGDDAIMDAPASSSERQILRTIVAERVVRLRQIEQRFASLPTSSH